MLHIYLFKDLRVCLEGGAPLNLGSPTTRSLLGYLALNRHRPLDRRHLAFVFWPQASEVAARRNLRQYLHRLHAALGPVEHAQPLLLSAEHSVQLSAGADVWVDVEQFEQDCRAGDDALAHAAQLYQGDLLEDLYDEWIAPERERLRQAYLAALERLAERQRAGGRLAQAVATAQTLLAADPLQERSHALLMTLYYSQGERARALQQFKTCCQLLRDGLGVEPMPELRALYESLAAGSYQVQGSAPPLAPPRRPEVHGAPHAPHASARPPAPAAPVGAEPLSLPFVGREAQMAQLESCFAALGDGHGRMIFVQGEPGVGKTRLVQEALCRAQRAVPRLAVYAGQGREFEAMMPYHPLTAALRDASRGSPPAAWMETLAPFLPELAPRAQGAAPPPARFDRYQVAEALGTFFLEQAALAPTVLFVDDAQWADLPTWEFLGYLARRCASAALLVICAAPAEDLPPESARLVRTLLRQALLLPLEVPRLAGAEAARLVAEFGQDADGVLVRRLYEETAGNPFFVIETLRALRDAGGAWTLPSDAAGRRPAFAVPLRVRAVIEARLDRLDAGSRQLLATAAAIGRTFSLSLLQHIVEDTHAAMITALEDWLARRLVQEVAADAGRERPQRPSDLTYGFGHDLIRHVAYEQISHPRRRWVHRRIAEALEAQEGPAAHDAAEIAHHFQHSDAPERAVPYLIAAGDQALATRSYALARQFGVQAVSLLKEMPAAAGRREGQIELNLQLALASSFTGEVDRALAILQETEALAAASNDRSRLARTYYRTSQVSWRCGRAEVASEYARRALRLAEELGDAGLLASSLRMLGRTAIATSAFDDAISALQRCLALVVTPGERDPLRADVAVVHGYLSVAWARVGAWPQALASAQAGVEQGMRSAGSSTLAVALVHLAFVHAERRDWHGCLDAARRGIALCREQEIGFSPHGFMLQALEGLALCQHGAHAEGTAQIGAALELAQANDHRVFVYLPYLFQAQAWLGQDPRAAAGPEVAGWVEGAHAMARAAGDRWAQGVALRLRAELHERDAAPAWANVEADLVASAALLRQVRARPELARTYLSLRRLYERAAQMAWAVDCHFRATTIFEELGMTDELRAAQGTPLGSAAHARGGLTGAALTGPHGQH